MPDLSDMNTLSEVMQKLQERNIPEFLFTDKGFTPDNARYYLAGDLQIVKVYRFEGMSDPSDMSIVYVLETTEGQHGYSLNAYGVYDNHGQAYDNFIRAVPEKGHEEQLTFSL
jgi:hypothetical protein